MTSLWEAWFQDNFTVVSFGYGLVFFLAGFSVALTARNFAGSRLPLAAGLPYLAAFGLLLGVAEWGVVFLPLQAAYLSPANLHALSLVQTGALVLAYTSLLGFGLVLVIPRASGFWWTLQVGAVIGLASTVLLAGLTDWPGPALADLRQTLHTLAAWGAGVPGSLLGATGLWRQYRETARYSAAASRWLSGAGAILMLSAPLGVLAVPTSPVDVAGYASVRTLFGIPLQVVLAAGGLLLTTALLKGLEVFRLENLRRHEQATLRQAAMAERLRIGHALNDGTIQELFAATMLIDSALSELESDPDAAANSLTAALTRIQITTERLQRFIMDPERGE